MAPGAPLSPPESPGLLAASLPQALPPFQAPVPQHNTTLQLTDENWGVLAEFGGVQAGLREKPAGLAFYVGC